MENKVKVSKVLYVGLGGTGINTILQTKKAFEETYGEIPPTLGFLSFDTNVLEFSTGLLSETGNTELKAGEKGNISVDNALETYKSNISYYPWMPVGNVSALRILKNGAGQVRTNGRYAAAFHTNKIKEYINNTLNTIKNARHRDNDKFDWNDHLYKVDVHIVFSVAGGTGCGTFIDMAYLIKEAAVEHNHSVKIYGYALLPDVFSAMNPDSDFSMKENAFGALSDLDYIIHSKSTASRIGDRNITLEGSPFDLFFCIDNKNDEGDTSTDILELAEMLGNALCITSGAIGDVSTGFLDNFENKIYSENSYIVKNKMSWICRIGASKIIFDPNKAANIYKLKAAKKLIDLIAITSTGNIDEAEANADTWMSDVKIVETDKDDLIQSIRPNGYPESKMEDMDEESPKADIDRYYNQFVTTENPDLSRILDVVQDEIVEKVTKSLKETIIKQVKESKHPIEKPFSFLNRVKEQIKIYGAEMEKEKNEFDGLSNSKSNKSIASLEAAVAKEVEELKELTNKWGFWGKKKRILFHKDAICSGAYNVARAKIEKDRRVRAISIYRRLETVVNEELNKIELLKSYLVDARSIISAEISVIEVNEKRYPGLFTIDLAKEIGLTQTIVIKDTDVNVNSFIKSLGKNTLLDCQDEDSIKEVVLNYTNSLTGTNEVRNRTVDAVLDEIRANDMIKFKDIIKRATAKAKPVLPISCNDKYNSGRPVNAQNQISQYLVGVPDKDTCPIITPKNHFKETQKVDDNPTYHSTGMSDRIIIYRVDGIIPAYAVGAVKSFRYSYEKALKSGNLLPHFDANIFEQMKKEKFSIFPKENDEETYKYWVFGLIFDCFVKVRKEDGIYYYFNPDSNSTSAVGEGWISTHTEKRKNAFDQFASQLPDFKDKYEKEISYQINKNSAAITARIQGAMEAVSISGVNTCKYLTEPAKYSKSPYSASSVYVNSKSSNDATSKQIIKEISFLKDLLSELGLGDTGNSFQIDLTI